MRPPRIAGSNGGVVQAAVSQLDFDFASYAAEHFERMQRTAAEPEFTAALDA